MNPGFVLLVRCPPGRFPEGCLEVALGAAALDLPLEVVFVGAGLGQLSGKAGQAWSQIPDFEMGRLWYRSDGDEGGPLPPAGMNVRPLDAASWEKLARGRRVLEL